MKRVLIGISFALTLTGAYAQTKKTELTRKNSWLKLGAIAGLPVGNSNTNNNFVGGLDLKAQLMLTRHLGIGLTAGYNHFLAKRLHYNFGIVPLGGIIRVYPAAKGLYLGVDGGMAIVTGLPGSGEKSGIYLRPQAGYHNYSWNIYGFYDHIYRDIAKGGKIQYAGIGCSYNLRFK